MRGYDWKFSWKVSDLCMPVVSLCLTRYPFFGLETLADIFPRHYIRTSIIWFGFLVDLPGLGQSNANTSYLHLTAKIFNILCNINVYIYIHILCRYWIMIVWCSILLWIERGFGLEPGRQDPRVSGLEVLHDMMTSLLICWLARTETAGSKW